MDVSPQPVNDTIKIRAAEDNIKDYPELQSNHIFSPKVELVFWSKI